jgi:hypothetical protein
MPGTISILDLGFSKKILEYLYICNEIPWRWDPSPNVNFLYFRYSFCMESGGNFIQYFSMLVLTETCHRCPGREYSLMAAHW